MFALAKNPKIPSDVININTSTAALRYDFIRTLILFQLICKNPAVTNLPISNTPPIIITGHHEPENMVASPITENQAATPATNNEVAKAILLIIEKLL